MQSITRKEVSIYLACECNSQGSIRHDGSPCYNKCCNDNGSCTCKKGYTGDKCNDCDEGYYEVDNINGEIICSGVYK